MGSVCYIMCGKVCGHKDLLYNLYICIWNEVNESYLGYHIDRVGLFTSKTSSM